MEKIKIYKKSDWGTSLKSGEKVEIVGERKLIKEDGRTFEQYLCRIQKERKKNKIVAIAKKEVILGINT